MACHDWVNHAHISSILTLWLSSANIFLSLYIFSINPYYSYIHAYQSPSHNVSSFSLSHTSMWTLFNTLADILPMGWCKHFRLCVSLIFNLANVNQPVDIFGNIPLEKLFALSGSPLLPLFQSYNVLFARQPSKEGGGLRTKKRSGKVRLNFHFAILWNFVLSNWKMYNLKKSQGILQQTWASLIFMVSSMSKIEPNVPH